MEEPGQVWAAGITYIPMREGFMYLAATLDWYSRNVVSWKVSNSLESSFCLEMLEQALSMAIRPFSIWTKGFSTRATPL